jgi:Zn-finger nucleic acid-binding protein
LRSPEVQGVALGVTFDVMYRSSTPGLACPECTTPLAQIDAGIAAHRCKSCSGVWLDAETSIAVLQARTEPTLREQEGAARGGRVPEDRPRSCARCGETMVPLPFGEVSLDNCPAHGTWFDRTELTRTVREAKKMEQRSGVSTRGVIDALAAWLGLYD